MNQALQGKLRGKMNPETLVVYSEISARIVVQSFELPY